MQNRQILTVDFTDFYSLDIELQERNIRTINVVLLLDLKVTQKSTIKGLHNGDQTVAFANLSGGRGGR